jgi:hypothetical protein
MNSAITVDNPLATLSMGLGRYPCEEDKRKVRMHSPAMMIEKYPGVEDAFFLAGVSASQDCSAKTTATLGTHKQQVSNQQTSLAKYSSISLATAVLS